MGARVYIPNIGTLSLHPIAQLHDVDAKWSRRSKFAFVDHETLEVELRVGTAKTSTFDNWLVVVVVLGDILSNS